MFGSALAPVLIRTIALGSSTPHTDHPAWPVILETATDQLDAIRQQCRRQGITLVGRILAPVNLKRIGWLRSRLPPNE